MANTHPAKEMLRGYAAGTLPPGLSLLVATHLGFCRCCRDKVAGLEALCGALLAGTEPVPPTRRCLKDTLARLETCGDPCPAPAPGNGLPPPLCRTVGGAVSALPWAAAGDGVAEAPLAGFAGERVALARAAPGARLALRDGGAALLVLDGGLLRASGRLEAGDVAVGDGAGGDGGGAAGPEPCLCLLVRGGQWPPASTGSA